MELSQLLSGLISGALTVPAVNWLLGQLPPTLTKSQKRYTAIGVSFLLGLGAFLLSIWLGYIARPITPEGWFNALWPVGASAFTASQVVLSMLRERRSPAGADSGTE